VPAHASCNSKASLDEEYLRDLLAQEAVKLGLPGAEALNDKVWRAWAGPGWNRYQGFMKVARVLREFTPTGLYVGKALGISVDTTRVKSVCRKVARGIIYHDSGAFVQDSELMVTPLPVSMAMKEREKNTHELFWVCMGNDTCLHDMCADTIALRRFYEGIPMVTGLNPVANVGIMAHIAIMMWNLFCVSSAIFPLKRVRLRDFRFAINTVNGTWVRGDK
jgi:hypothetical protein